MVLKPLKPPFLKQQIPSGNRAIFPTLRCCYLPQRHSSQAASLKQSLSKVTQVTDGWGPPHASDLVRQYFPPKKQCIALLFYTLMIKKQCINFLPAEKDDSVNPHTLATNAEMKVCSGQQFAPTPTARRPRIAFYSAQRLAKDHRIALRPPKTSPRPYTGIRPTQLPTSRSSFSRLEVRLEAAS